MVLVTGSPSSLCEELLFFYLYAKVQVMICNILTAIIYYYIMTKFHYAKRDSGFSACEGVMLKRFECTKVTLYIWGKALIDILTKMLVFLQ